LMIARALSTFGGSQPYSTEYDARVLPADKLAPT
jgi:hypothetical protein